MDLKLTSIFLPLKDYKPSISVIYIFYLVFLIVLGSGMVCNELQHHDWNHLLCQPSLNLPYLYGTILSCVGITNLETTLVFCQQERGTVT